MTDVRMASEKQINYLKTLVKRKKISDVIDYESLSSKHASELISRIQELPAATDDFTPVVKTKSKVASSDMKICHGLCYKVTFNAMNSNGRISKEKQDEFVTNVCEAMILYWRSLNAARSALLEIEK